MFHLTCEIFKKSSKLLILLRKIELLTMENIFLTILSFFLYFSKTKSMKLN